MSPFMSLSFLLGQYCSSDDEDVIETGVANVKRILAENYVPPRRGAKILPVLRQRGSYTVIDKITVNLNIKTDSMRRSFQSRNQSNSYL
jgi:ATP-dependent Lon protease